MLSTKQWKLISLEIELLPLFKVLYMSSYLVHTDHIQFHTVWDVIRFIWA